VIYAANVVSPGVVGVLVGAGSTTGGDTITTGVEGVEVAGLAGAVGVVVAGAAGVFPLRSEPTYLSKRCRASAASGVNKVRIKSTTNINPTFFCILFR
jgi:hypothetical protein